METLSQPFLHAIGTGVAMKLTIRSDTVTTIISLVQVLQSSKLQDGDTVTTTLIYSVGSGRCYNQANFRIETLSQPLINSIGTDGPLKGFAPGRI